METKEDLAKWVEEKEAKWKAEEPMRRLKQEETLRKLAAPSMEDQITELQATVKMLKDKMGIA